ncbi:MAG: Ig-like domain-containing protein [Deltaproteobacteria bacterium]|nr:Ig-like domain-containing protein [Deltaproteobacteria bacterium]
MLLHRLRNVLLASSLASATLFAGSTACSAKKNTEIMVAVQTDLRVPKDLNAVTLRVLSKGAVQYEETHVVGPMGLRLPATIGLVPQDEDDLQPIEVQVIGRFSTDPAEDPALRAERVLRKTRLTFAKGRVGMVRIPLKFVCYDVTDCKEGETCVAGACQPTPMIEGSAMPDYSAEAVFGQGGSEGKQGACFDGNTCLASSVPIAPMGDGCVFSLGEGGGDTDAGVTMPDTASGDGGAMMDASTGGPGAPCEIDVHCYSGLKCCAGRCSDPAMCTDADPAPPPDAAPPPDGGFGAFKRFDPTRPLTIALATSAGGLGFCDATTCRVPLDFDPVEGWSWADERKTAIRLAQGICAKVAAAKGAIRPIHLEATDACPTKVPELPLCDETSGTGPAEDSSVPTTGLHVANLESPTPIMTGPAGAAGACGKPGEPGFPYSGKWPITIRLSAPAPAPATVKLEADRGCIEGVTVSIPIGAENGYGELLASCTDAVSYEFRVTSRALSGVVDRTPPAFIVLRNNVGPRGPDGPPCGLGSITIEGPTYTTVGGWIPLRAMFISSGGGPTDVTESATWASTDPAVATVSNTAGTRGRVTGLGVGKSLISAWYGESSGGVDVFVTAGGADAGVPPDGGACTPRTCGFYKAACNTWADGCGGSIDCGSCSTGTSCQLDAASGAYICK